MLLGMKYMLHGACEICMFDRLSAVATSSSWPLPWAGAQSHMCLHDCIHATAFVFVSFLLVANTHFSAAIL